MYGRFRINVHRHTIQYKPQYPIGSFLHYKLFFNGPLGVHLWKGQCDRSRGFGSGREDLRPGQNDRPYLGEDNPEPDDRATEAIDSVAAAKRASQDDALTISSAVWPWKR